MNSASAMKITNARPSARSRAGPIVSPEHTQTIPLRGTDDETGRCDRRIETELGRPSVSVETQTPERWRSPVPQNPVGNVFSLAYSNQRAPSESTQQHGADEREYREHGQHIEPQGKVHVTSPVVC